MEERGLLSECSVEEGGHLASSDDTAGTVHIVDWGVAAFGDLGGAELVDVALEDGVIVVDEQVAASVVRQVQRTAQECCHLLASHGGVGAVPVVGWRVAAFRNAGFSKSVDVTQIVFELEPFPAISVRV